MKAPLLSAAACRSCTGTLVPAGSCGRPRVLLADAAVGAAHVHGRQGLHQQLGTTSGTVPATRRGAGAPPAHQRRSARARAPAPARAAPSPPQEDRAARSQAPSLGSTELALKAASRARGASGAARLLPRQCGLCSETDREANRNLLRPGLAGPRTVIGFAAVVTGGACRPCGRGRGYSASAQHGPRHGKPQDRMPEQAGKATRKRGGSLHATSAGPIKRPPRHPPGAPIPADQASR